MALRDYHRAESKSSKINGGSAVSAKWLIVLFRFVHVRVVTKE